MNENQRKFYHLFWLVVWHRPQSDIMTEHQFDSIIVRSFWLKVAKSETYLADSTDVEVKWDSSGFYANSQPNDFYSNRLSIKMIDSINIAINH